MRVCCYVDPAAEAQPLPTGVGVVGCESAAVWEICWAEPGKALYDSTTDACAVHVAAMLNVADVKEYNIYPIDESEGTVD